MKKTKQSKRQLSLRQRESLSAYLYISPWVVGFIALTIGPMIASLYFSFTDYNVISPPVWNNFANYRKIFSGLPQFIISGNPAVLGDPLFWQSLKVTLYFALLSLPLGLVFSFFIAVLLNQKIRGVNFWRTIYFLPSVIAGVAVTILWMRIFNPRVGLLNPFLENVLHIKGPGWMTDPNWAVPALVIMGLWGAGGSMIIYLAGLQGVSTDLYDAAKVDGAGLLQRFLHVTLPQMTPVIFYNLVLSMIGSFQYFTEAYVASGGSGGPARATLFYNLYLYQNAFKFFEMGYASTMAWILFLIVLILTILVFKSSELWVFYEGEMRGK